MDRGSRRRWFVPLCCGVYVTISLLHVDAPFLRHNETVSAFYCSAARNFVRHGYGPLKLGILEATSLDLSAYEDWRAYYYPNRPAVSPLALSLWFHLFGSSETACRANLIVIGVCTLLVFAGIARRLLAEGWEMAVGTFTLLPVFAYSSHTIPHLSYALLFSLLAWYAFLRERDGRIFRFGLFAALILACLTDWLGYFAALSLALAGFRGWKGFRSYAILATAVVCFGLHLLHLYWLSPDGRLVTPFLHGGAARTAAGFPGMAAWLRSEIREFGIYFTVGGGLLALIGLVRAIRGRSWRVLALSLLGLEEFLFARWAYHHDFLTYGLAPFAALLIAQGTPALWSRRWGKGVACFLIGSALVQAGWILWDRHSRFGASEVPWRAGVAIRDMTQPRHRILLTIADMKQLAPYYAERYVASAEAGYESLIVHWSGPTVSLGGVEGLVHYISEHGREYDVIVAGDPEAVPRHVRFFSGGLSPDQRERFGFFPADHPLRCMLERIAIRKEIRGAFIFYWMR